MMQNAKKPLVTDFHSHILPFMDDGSASIEDSLEMLKLLRAQGVDRVVATPHFYPKQEDPESFLQRRAQSAQMLRSAILFSGLDKSEIPEIYIGAEVAYFGGMSLYKNIGDLCIEGTSVMLVEMPFSKWTDVVVSEVCRVKNELGIQVVLAHVDRYGHYYDFQKLFKLKTHRVIMQANADPFLRFIPCRRLLKMINMGMIGVLGSDFHNMTERPSNMDEAMEIIRARGFGAKLDAMMNKAEDLLSEAKPLI